MATLSASSTPSWPSLPHKSNPNPEPNQNPIFLSSIQQPEQENSSPPSSPQQQQQQQQQRKDDVPEEEEEEEFHEDVMSNSSSLTSPSSSIQNPNKPPIHPIINNNDSLSSTQPPSSIPLLLHLSFNQDHGCFAVGTDHGFRIYNCDPFQEIFRREFDDGGGSSGGGGGIGGVEMLFRCNILSLVGGGTDPQYPNNKVMIWDDHQRRCIGELTFMTEVRAVRLRRDRIIVVLEQKILVYNFVDLKLLHQIETIANPKGLCEVSHVSGSLVLVCPGLQKGQVRVEDYGFRRTKFIMAHDSRIACFALTQDGKLLATASSKGTLVRVYNTSDGTLLQEVRRGADRADIYSLAFSPTAQWLAVSSDKGTVHVFSLKVNSGSSANDMSSNASDPNISVRSASSSFSFIKGVLPKYFNSEWSMAQFRLQEGTQSIVAFGHQKNTIVILGMDGSFYRCRFDPTTGGEMTQLEFHNFLKPEEAF